MTDVAEMTVKFNNSRSMNFFEGYDNLEGVNLAATESKFNELVAERLGVAGVEIYYADSSVQYHNSNAVPITDERDSPIAKDTFLYAIEKVSDQGAFWVMD